MIALRVEDRKKFTSELFIGEMFDSFLVQEATFVTFSTFKVDGRTRQGYYTEQELETGRVEDYVSWKVLKPFCFYLIKGKRLPEKFHIVFQLPPSAVERFLTNHGLGWKAEQIRGLYLNVRYEEGVISCVTGTSLEFFTLDKTLEQAWDEAVEDFLRRKYIPFQGGKE